MLLPSLNKVFTYLLTYYIRLNYHTDCVLRFFKNTGKTCRNLYLPTLQVHFKKLSKDLPYDVFAMCVCVWMRVCVFACVCVSDFLYKSICCRFSFELQWQVNAIQMCIHNICLFKKVDKKYTGCDQKTTELPDCALFGVCAVIRSNKVCNNLARRVRVQPR